MKSLILAFVLLEVMDKELTVPGVWFAFVIPGLIGFLLGRRTWWAGIPMIAWITLGAVVQLLELHDPFVGQSILSEAGPGYFIQSYAAIAVSLSLALGGMRIGWNSRREQTV